MTGTNILLGTIAGVTIFLGLPVARWRGASERLRGLLTLASAGVLLFLIIEVGYHAMESVEATAKGASVNAALAQSLILVGGVLVGLVGLAWLESHRARQLEAGAEALEIATMIAIGEVVVSAGGKISVLITGNEGQYRLVDERGQSATATIAVRPSGTLEPLTDEVNAAGALTVLEGHVRASKELHDRGVSGKGPDPTLDLKRAGKHAGHPQHELLIGSDPDALALQKLLRARGVFEELNNALSAYVSIAPDAKASPQEVDQKYRAALVATEQARRAIAGAAYDTPAFRARIVRFVLDTAASEYATASEGGRINVQEPGVPGKDNFIEYQDARGFLRAARELSLRNRTVDSLTADSRIAFDTLLNEVFATLDPPDPNRPLPSAEVRALIERVERGLEKIRPD